MLINDKIKLQLGSIWPWMQELVESELWDNLYKQLKSISASGKEIIPKSADLWKSLELIDKNNIKAVILLQCPYATKRNGVTIANGLPMDCSNIAPYQQPSLHHWWNAVEEQYGFHPDNDNRCDLSYLIREEGVLMMNSANSVELNKVDSHAQMWHPITRWIIENIVNRYLNGVPVVLIGTQAQKFEQYLNPLANPIKKVEHMAAAAYADRKWAHGNLHKWCNEIIRANNGSEHEIQWLRRKNEQPKVKEENKLLDEWLSTSDGTTPDDLPF